MALYTEALSRDAVDDIQGDPGSAVLHFLRHGDDPESIHTFSEKELSDQQDKIAKVTQGIRERNFEPSPNEYGVCKWCDYKDFICPAWEEWDLLPQDLEIDQSAKLWSNKFHSVRIPSE